MMKRDWQDFLDGNRSAVSAQKSGVYAGSVIEKDSSTLFLASGIDGWKLVVKGTMSELFDGTISGDAVVCDANVQNAYKLMQIFEQFRPKSHRGSRASFGLGDRLGCATPGQLRAIGETEVFPVLAQQSMRELGLTGRDYRQVIADACFGVMATGWQGGYGADGDHLKHSKEVAQALDAGCTMITLDLSGVMAPRCRAMDGSALNTAFKDAFGVDGQSLIERYSSISIDGSPVPVNGDDIKRYALVYKDAFAFVEDVWKLQITPPGKHVDLEISIDETDDETTPAEHYFVAMELKRRGISVTSLAPRFPGEFQKAVDYYGDADELSRSLALHAAIARELGYKLSIHSGSDKWTAFPLIAKHTGGHYHIKTSGTNWLEMIKMIAGQNPALYRRMHKHALAVFDEASKNYHVSAKPASIPNVDVLTNRQLPGLFEQDDARQLMHITYGQMLGDKDHAGEYLLRGEIFETLEANKEAYWELLHKHIGKHLHLLGEC